MWTRLVRISDPGQWFGKIHEPVTRVQHLVRTNSYVNATVSLVRRYGAVVCMKKRELTQDPDWHFSPPACLASITIRCDTIIIL